MSSTDHRRLQEVLRLEQLFRYHHQRGCFKLPPTLTARVERDHVKDLVSTYRHAFASAICDCFEFLRTRSLNEQQAKLPVLILIVSQGLKEHRHSDANSHGDIQCRLNAASRQLAKSHNLAGSEVGAQVFEEFLFTSTLRIKHHDRCHTCHVTADSSVTKPDEKIWLGGTFPHSCQLSSHNPQHRVGVRETDSFPRPHVALLENRQDSALAELESIGLDDKMTDRFGRNPLHLAAELGHKDFICKLRERNYDLFRQLQNEIDNYRLTPLATAILKGDVAVFNAFYDEGQGLVEDLGQRVFNQSLLELAAEAGAVEIIRQVFSHLTPDTVRSQFRQSLQAALGIALKEETPSVELIMLLLSEGAVPDEHDLRPLKIRKPQSHLDAYMLQHLTQEMERARENTPQGLLRTYANQGQVPHQPLRNKSTVTGNPPYGKETFVPDMGSFEQNQPVPQVYSLQATQRDPTLRSPAPLAIGTRDRVRNRSLAQRISKTSAVNLQTPRYPHTQPQHQARPTAMYPSGMLAHSGRSMDGYPGNLHQHGLAASSGGYMAQQRNAFKSNPRQPGTETAQWPSISSPAGDTQNSEHDHGASSTPLAVSARPMEAQDLDSSELQRGYQPMPSYTELTQGHAATSNSTPASLQQSQDTSPGYNPQADVGNQFQYTSAQQPAMTHGPAVAGNPLATSMQQAQVASFGYGPPSDANNNSQHSLPVYNEWPLDQSTAERPSAPLTQQMGMADASTNPQVNFYNCGEKELEEPPHQYVDPARMFRDANAQL